MLSVAGRVLALLFALSWLVLPGFGLIDLSVTWSPDWPVMLEAGWGLFFSVFVGVSFLAVALVPRRSAAAVVQLCLASLALAVTAAVSLEWQALGLAAAVAVETAVVTRAQQVEPLLPLVTAGSTPLLLLTAAAAPPWLAYGWHMADLNRQELPSSDITISVDHYSVQAATALTMVALALLAALATRPTVPREQCRCCRPLPGRRLVRLAGHPGRLRPHLVRRRRRLGCLLDRPRVDARTRTAQLGTGGGRHSLSRSRNGHRDSLPVTSRDFRS